MNKFSLFPACSEQESGDAELGISDVVEDVLDACRRKYLEYRRIMDGIVLAPV
jgi:hypothetical protein